MTPLTNMRGKKHGSSEGGTAGYTVRCTPVDAQRALAIIKRHRLSDAAKPAITDRLLKIAGVSQVRVDSLRGTIQVIYDGQQGTVESLHRFLVATAWDG